jgi:uncharacterized HAD superfamily protein
MNKVEELLSESSEKKIAVDVDGTLTVNAHIPDFYDRTHTQMKEYYLNCKPRQDIIDWVNKKADEGWIIYIYTARDDIYEKQTIEWLKKHNVKYEYVVMKKLYFDLFIEDKAVRPEELL